MKVCSQWLVSFDVVVASSSMLTVFFGVVALCFVDPRS